MMDLPPGYHGTQNMAFYEKTLKDILGSGMHYDSVYFKDANGGTSQPNILTMMHAVKGMNFNLGGLDINKILAYEKQLQLCLQDYFIPPEATKVSPIIPFSPMPGGALTANTQMMRDNGLFDKFSQEALENVLQGPWKTIVPGFSKMVLGYFEKTPISQTLRLLNLHQRFLI